MRVLVADPSAFTPPYDHALCSALARAGAEVELATSAFAHGAAPSAVGYVRDESFYRRGSATGGAARQAAKLAQHVPDMLRLRARVRKFDVVHFQWLAVQHLDALLLPRRRPVVLTAHDILPREPRPGQRAAQQQLYDRVDAVVVHSEHGRSRLAELGVDATVIPHGAFEHLLAETPRLPPELPGNGPPVVLFFGLVRPYKGLDLLFDAWPSIGGDAELWVVGRHRSPLPAVPPARVRVLDRFVSDSEVAALFRRARLAVLPYRESEGSGVLATALAFGTPLVCSDVGAFREAPGARLVTPGDPYALGAAISELLGDEPARAELSVAATDAAAGLLSWDSIAERHLELYRSLVLG